MVYNRVLCKGIAICAGAKTIYKLTPCMMLGLLITLELLRSPPVNARRTNKDQLGLTIEVALETCPMLVRCNQLAYPGAIGA